MHPLNPGKHYIVRMDKTYEDEMIFESGVRLFKPIHLNPEWNTSVTGQIISRPAGSPYLPTDTLLFTYDVVEDKELRDDDTPIHRNQFRHEGVYYWKVEDMFLLGAIREGEMIPDPRYVFLKPVEAEKTERIGLIWVPEVAQEDVKKNRAACIAGEWKGQTVVYNDRYAQKYEVKRADGTVENIIVLPRQYVAAVEQE